MVILDQATKKKETFNLDQTLLPPTQNHLDKLYTDKGLFDTRVSTLGLVWMRMYLSQSTCVEWIRVELN